MALYQAICQKCGLVEIIKGMEEPFPQRHGCGAGLTRIYGAPPVHYKSNGFRDYDDGLKKSIGKERYAKYEARKKRLLDSMPRGGADALEN